MGREYIKCESINTVDEFMQRWGKKYIEYKDTFKQYCINFQLFPLTQSKFISRLKLLKSVSINNSTNPDELMNLLQVYHNCRNTSLKQDIKNGKGSGKLYTDKLKHAIVRRGYTIGSIDYFKSKGYTEEQAYTLHKENYNRLNKLATSKCKEIRETDPGRWRKRYIKIDRKTKPIYWINRGYTEAEAKNIIKNKYTPPLNSLEGFVKRHGKDIGQIKYTECKDKRLKSRSENYINSYIKHTSKESLRYFRKIYKKLRRNNIFRGDIIWGIGNRKEFITKDPNTKRIVAYDFVIKPLNIIIEYNHPFWHARDRNEWKNPFVSYDKSKELDEFKKSLANQMGYELITIWSDKLPNVDDLINKILKHPNERITNTK